MVISSVMYFSDSFEIDIEYVPNFLFDSSIPSLISSFISLCFVSYDKSDSAPVSFNDTLSTSDISVLIDSTCPLPKFLKNSIITNAEYVVDFIILPSPINTGLRLVVLVSFSSLPFLVFGYVPSRYVSFLVVFS